MLFGIYRREPRGKWAEVDQVVQPRLNDAVMYYKDTYLHDDVDGTEVIFIYHKDNQMRVTLRKVSVPRPEPTLTMMHWDGS